MTDSDDYTALTESSASQILERAASIDASGGPVVSVEDLRAAAIEAGISPEAFDRALTEFRRGAAALAESSPQQPVQRAASPPEQGFSMPTWLERTGLFATGSLLSVLIFVLADIGVDDVVAVALGLFVAAMILVARALKQRRGRKVIEFLFDHVALWLGLVMILIVGEPASADEILLVLAPIGGLAALILGPLVGAGPEEETPRQLPPGLPEKG